MEEIKNNLPEKTTQKSEESNVLMDELLEIVAEELLPKLKKFMPRILDMIEKDDTIINPDQIAVLTKNSVGKLVIVVTNKDLFSLNTDPKTDGISKAYSFNNLMNNAIEQVLNKTLK